MYRFTFWPDLYQLIKDTFVRWPPSIVTCCNIYTFTVTLETHYFINMSEQLDLESISSLDEEDDDDERHPAFYQGLREKYSKIVKDDLEESVHTAEADSNICPPFDATRPILSGLEWINLPVHWH